MSIRIRKKLGNKIIKLRLEKSLSQEELANIIKSSRSYVSEIENGKCNIGIDLLERIANAFGITLEELLKDI